MEDIGSGDNTAMLNLDKTTKRSTTIDQIWKYTLPKGGWRKEKEKLCFINGAHKPTFINFHVLFAMKFSPVRPTVFFSKDANVFLWFHPWENSQLQDYNGISSKEMFSVITCTDGFKIHWSFQLKSVGKVKVTIEDIEWYWCINEFDQDLLMFIETLKWTKMWWED